MSFILDALRKSETDRQQKGTAEFASVPTRRETPRTPAWLWVIGILLAVNLTVLLGLLLRPDPTAEAARAAAAPVTPSPAVTATAPPAEPAGDEDFASRIAAARENAPAQARQTVTPTAQPQPVTAQPAPPPAQASGGRTSALPTIHELQARGSINLPPLHVDIHVYSEISKDRFVFINMNKAREGERLAEGPVVDTITADGVVMTHNGTTFLVPRD